MTSAPIKNLPPVVLSQQVKAIYYLDSGSSTSVSVRSDHPSYTPSWCRQTLRCPRIHSGRRESFTGGRHVDTGYLRPQLHRDKNSFFAVTAA